MKDINSATKVTAIDASDQLLVSDGGTALAKIDYNVLAKAIIEQYTGSSVAGKAQSLKAALDALNSKIENFNVVRTAINSAGTQTYALTHSHIYLVTVARGSSTESATAGIYIVTAYNGAGLCKAISESSVASVSVNKTTLTITTTASGVLISIMQIA